MNMQKRKFTNFRILVLLACVKGEGDQKPSEIKKFKKVSEISGFFPQPSA